MLNKIKLYSALALIGIVLIIVFQNTQAVETRLLFMSVIMPRAALLGITLLIGVFIGILATLSISGNSSEKK